MTALAIRPHRTLVEHASGLPTWTVAAATTAAVASRLPFLGHAPRPDEAGFLLVGGQWNGAGSSLYGNYWVDRPPLLITIFRFASSLGGLTALRLIGCVAVALVVIGSARVAGLLGGHRAARWAAVTAAGLSLSPLLGGYEVDGELLAAPFTLAGIALVIVAVRSVDQRRAVVAAVAAGTFAMSSLLIKQNLADAAVFGAVAFALSLWRRDITRHRFGMLTLGAIAGAFAAGLLLAGWTVLHGTSLTGVFDAMYPFRIRADQVQAAGGAGHSTARLYGLIGVATVSGLGLLMLLVARDVVARRHRDTLWMALVATTLFAVVSIFLGGNYWHHYLVELIAPLSVATGVLAARHGIVARSLIAYVIVAASVGWAVSLSMPQGNDASSVGRAVGASSQPGDTIVTAWGRANVTYSSGLSSPYAQLWSLPAKTIDPQLTELNGVLTGPSAPTWLVSGPTIRSWGLDTAQTAAILSQDYHPVEQLCGRTIYLHDGLDRPTPSVIGTCHGATTPLSPMKELTP